MCEHSKTDLRDCTFCATATGGSVKETSCIGSLSMATKIGQLSHWQRLDLLIFLAMKRQVDGLNGRPWDGSEHLHWEQKVSALLDR